MQNLRFLEQENQRMEAYRLLSELFHLPDSSVGEKIRELKRILNELCIEASHPLAQLKDSFSTEELKIDFSRLFVGPFKLLAPPYGSVYLEGSRRVMGDSTLDARKRYQASGLDISNDFIDAPDHIAVELEFIYFLIYKQLEALNEADFESALSLLKLQSAFLHGHLGAWVSKFADEVIANAESEFYRSLAQATSTFILSDKKVIKEESIPPIEKLLATGIA